MKNPYIMCSACWPEEHRWILVNLWCEASKTFDFNKRARNNFVHMILSERFAVLGIIWSTDQCGERVKRLKTDYC